MSELKNQLSAWLRKVRGGATVVIYDRNLPVARLERVESGGRDGERLALLQSQGILRPPASAAAVRQLRRRLAPLAAGKALREALRRDRDEGR